MLRLLRKLFSEEEKEEKEKKEEKDETAMENNDYENDYENDLKKLFKEKVPEYVSLIPEEEFISGKLKLHIYFKGDYLGYIVVNQAKVGAYDLKEEKRVFEMISKKVKDREEELEQLRICREMEKEKLEFMRLRNEMLKKKLAQGKE